MASCMESTQTESASSFHVSEQNKSLRSYKSCWCIFVCIDYRGVYCKMAVVLPRTRYKPSPVPLHTSTPTPINSQLNLPKRIPLSLMRGKINPQIREVRIQEDQNTGTRMRLSPASSWQPVDNDCGQSSWIIPFQLPDKITGHGQV